MTFSEFKDWVSVINEVVVAVAAVITVGVGLYGLRVWKRDLVGKEVYIAVRALVRQLHITARAANNVRARVDEEERRPATAEERENFTVNEIWRKTEAEIYWKRLDVFTKEMDTLRDAKLDVRILVGSKIYAHYLPFDKLMGKAQQLVLDYIDLLQDNTLSLVKDSPAIEVAQNAMYPARHLNDALSEQIGDEKERAEVAVLRYLHRTSIRGGKVSKRELAVVLETIKPGMEPGD